jgi:nucleotide-binding universal stress UspA family protein
MNVRHILLTTDLSPNAARPFQPVRELARSLGAGITLLNVVLDLQALPHGAAFAPAISSPDLGKEVEAARADLEGQREDLGDDIEVAIEVVSAPDVANGICAWAASHDVDLIALSTHGRQGWRHLALGSVTEQVLRKTEIPVLTFHRPKK